MRRAAFSSARRRARAGSFSACAISDAGLDSSTQTKMLALVQPGGGAKDGFGLGLVVVRDLAEANGGKVTVENAEPGLRITVTMKIAEPGSRRADVHIDCRRRSAFARWHCRPADPRRLSPARSPKTAPRRSPCFQQSKPDLCVFDVMMPHMDGLTLCREIRRLDPLVPILLLSARGEETDRVRGLDVGADDYVAKPFGARELVARVKAALRRAKAQETTSATPPVKAEPATDQNGRSRYRSRKPCAPFAARRDRSHLARSGDPGSRFMSGAARPSHAMNCSISAWGRGFMPNSRALDQYVSALRKKIEIDPAAPASSAQSMASAIVTMWTRLDSRVERASWNGATRASSSASRSMARPA